MPNEVKGQIDKLRTTVRWDPDTNELVTVLDIWATGITPDQLRQLFLFQSSGALNFSITSAQATLFPLEGVTAAGGSPDLPLVYKPKTE